MPKAVQLVPHTCAVSRGQRSGLVLCVQFTQRFTKLSLNLSAVGPNLSQHGKSWRQDCESAGLIAHTLRKQGVVDASTLLTLPFYTIQNP